MGGSGDHFWNRIGGWNAEREKYFKTLKPEESLQASEKHLAAGGQGAAHLSGSSLWTILWMKQFLGSGCRSFADSLLASNAAVIAASAWKQLPKKQRREFILETFLVCENITLERLMSDDLYPQLLALFSHNGLRNRESYDFDVFVSPQFDKLWYIDRNAGLGRQLHQSQAFHQYSYVCYRHFYLHVITRWLTHKVVEVAGLQAKIEL
ncbi:hypothetical protein JCM11641_008347 [Rhodosporidiobolus odoratus]